MSAPSNTEADTKATADNAAVETVEVHFANEDKTVIGKVGETILELAERSKIALDHACGGVCACSTCHVKIEAGADAFGPPTEDEEDQLDNARDVSLESRLGCQIRILRKPKAGKIQVRIPSWNVNLAQEPH